MNKRANSASSAQEVVEFQNIFSKLGKSLDASVPQISTYLNGANGNPPRMVQLSPKSNPRLVLTDTVDGPILAPRDPGLKAHQRWILRPMIHDGNTLLEMTMSTAFRERQNPSQVTAGDASRKLHLHWTEKRTTGGIDGMRWKIVVTGELGWYGLSIIPYYNVNKFLAAPVGVNDPRWTSKPRADAFDDSQKWRITTF